VVLMCTHPYIYYISLRTGQSGKNMASLIQDIEKYLSNDVCDKIHLYAYLE
jgi:hypothetical protein